MLNEISVCVNDIERHPLALIAACKFAEQYSGRVTAVYIKPDVSGMAEHQELTSPDAIQNAILEVNEQENKVRKCFESLTADFDVSKVWRSIAESLHPIQQIICSDVIFANQTDPEKTVVSPDSLIYRLILETKRPVIMIPHGWDADQFGSNILLGWNDSPEAMRAVSDALPLLQAASKVMVLDILDGRMQREEYEGLNHIQEYLSHKKVENQLIIENADEPDEVPEVFGRYIKSGEFDLAVIGGYGHSRAGEIVMGGVTNHLIQESSIPILFAH